MKLFYSHFINLNLNFIMTKNLRFKKLLGVFAIAIAASFLFSQASLSQNVSSLKVLHAAAFSDANNGALSADFVGVIDNGAKTVTFPDFPFGTALGALTLDFEASDKSNVYYGQTVAAGTNIGDGLGAGVNVVAGATIDLTVAANLRILVQAENHSLEYWDILFGVAAASSDKDLTSFTIAGKEYKVLPTGTGACDPGTAIGPFSTSIVGTAVTITVPFGTDLTALTTAGSYTGTGIAPAFGALNYVGPTAYTVTAQDGSTQVFTLTITVALANNDKEMSAFSFPAVATAPVGVINTTTHTIAITVPFGTALGAIVPTFTTSYLSRTWVGGMAGTEICSGVTAVDFSGGPVAFDVYAQDITEIQTYTVTVTVAPVSTVALLDDIQFTSAISACGPAMTWDSGVLVPVAGATTDVTYQFGAVLSAVTFTFNTSDAFATIAEATLGAIVSGTAYDVSAIPQLVITVTAQDGVTTNVYTIDLTKGQASNGKDMMEIGFYTATNLALSGLDVDIKDDAYDANLKFVVTAPWYVDLFNMKAYFLVSDYACVFIAPPGGGAYVPQTSDVTLNDHSNSITYVVIAQDGTEERFDVEVHKQSASSEKDMTAFSFDGLGICSAIVSAPTYDADGVLVGNDYTVTVRYGTDVTALVASFTNSALSMVSIGAVTQTSGVTANDFTSAVTYTVTAEDGTTQTYTVTVVIHPLASGAAYSDKVITDYQIPVALNAGKGLGAFDPEVVINQARFTIDVYIAWEGRSFVNDLIATFKLNGVEGNTAFPWTVLTRSEDTQALQVSGVTSNDYTTPIAYTVWAEDCTSVEYFVYANVIPDTDVGISCFEFSYSDCGCDLETVIDTYAYRIYVTVPYTVSITSLAPTDLCVAVGATKYAKKGSGWGPWDAAQNWTKGVIQYKVVSPDGNNSQIWEVIVENPPCQETTLLDDVSADTNVAISLPSGIQIGDPSVDEDTNTITFLVQPDADLSKVLMYWDLPCGADICCNMGACQGTYIDFSGGGDCSTDGYCHTCIVTAQDETITEEWTICIKKQSVGVPEVFTESVIVWNCEDSVAVWADAPGTVWIVDEYTAAVVAAYQASAVAAYAAGDIVDGIDYMEDAFDELDDASDDHLAASMAYPVTVDSLGAPVMTYISTHGLYSGAYYAFSVDLCGNVSCVSLQKFYIDICEVEVADLCELKDSPLVWRYTVLGEVFVTYECDDYKFVQDDCGIKIDDSYNFNTLPTYGRGKGLTNLRGMVYDDGVQTTFVPLDCCPPDVTSSGNTITPIAFTYEEFVDGPYNDDHSGPYESMLVTITDPLEVYDDYDWYSYWTYSTGWNDQGTDFAVRNGFGGHLSYTVLGNFSCANYIGEDFPSVNAYYTGIRTNTSWGGMLTPRDMKWKSGVPYVAGGDIVAVTGPVIDFDPNPAALGGVFVGTCATLTINIHNTGIGNLPITALYLDNITGDDTFELMTPLNPNPTNIVPGTPMPVDVKWCPVVSGTGSTTLVVEYGVGLVLQIPINGATPIVFDVPYFTDFDCETEDYWCPNTPITLNPSVHGWTGTNDPRSAVFVYHGWGSGYARNGLNMRTRNYNPSGPGYDGVSVWTPGFNVPTTGDIVVSWQDARWGNPNDPDPRRIWISTNGITWSLLDSYFWADQSGPTGYPATTPADFTKKIYSLAAYAGQTVYFWFDFNNDTHDYNYWIIDNFAVQERITMPILSGSPNPADFGGAQVGEPASMTFNLTNGGISFAQVHSVELRNVTGPGVPTDFALVDTLYTYPVDITSTFEAWTLNPEAILNFDVVFTPEAIGISQAEIVVTWGLYDQIEYVIPVQGEGLSCDVAFPAQLGENHFFLNSWWEYTPEQFAVVTVHSCHPNQQRAGTEYSWDTWLYIYEDCGGALIGENDDMNDDCVINRTQSTVTWVAEAGHSYKIFWPWAFDSAHDDEEFVFVVEETYPTAGDICESAIPVELPVKNRFGTTVGFEDDYNYSSCSPNSNYMDGNDIVYSFTITEEQPQGYITGDIFGAYGGLHIVNVCPNEDMLKENCIAFAGGSMGGSFRKAIVPGDYYAVVSSWAPPQTLDFYFNLKWEDATGVESIDLLNSVNVYPNPNNGQFTLQVNNPEATDLTVEIMDVQGQIIYRNTVKSVMSYNEEIDASAFAKGIYHLRVSSGTEVKVKKVVIQ